VKGLLEQSFDLIKSGRRVEIPGVLASCYQNPHSAKLSISVEELVNVVSMRILK